MNHKAITAVLYLSIMLLAAASGAAAEPASDRGSIPIGEGEFKLDVSRGPLTVYTYRPAAFTAKSPIWVVIHGARRDVADHIVFDYYDVWAPLAEKYGALVLLPEFVKTKWPTSWQFQLGNVRTPALKPIPWEQTGFAVAEKAFQHAVAATGSERRRFSLYGHGAGAQWVQRYVLHSGGRYLDRAVAANPGWYMLPDEEFKYPYGLKGAPIPAETRKRAFASDFVLLLGKSDTSTGGILRENAETKAQGKNRYERGHFYFERSATAARSLGANFAWRIGEVPGAGHENEDMAPAAAKILATDELPAGF
jgi:poly(3-hydroxybutyrate) depolymerase